MTDPQNAVTQDELNAFTNAGARAAAPGPNTSRPTNDEVNAFASLQSPTASPSGQTQPHSFAEDVAQGFGATAAETLTTAGKIGNHIPGVKYVADKVGDIAGLPKLASGTNPYDVADRGTAPARTAAKSTTGGQIGGSLEGLGEFVSGEEFLKGLSLAERFGIASKIAKLAETHPSVARLLEIGLNSIRTGSVGTAQGLAHGETAGQALESGAVAAGTGATLEGAIEGVKAVAPTVKKIAGVEIPVRASQESKVAAAAEHAAPSSALQKFTVQETQPAAKKAIGSVTTDVRDAGVNRMGATDSADFRQAVTETGKGKSFWDMTPEERGKAVARAQELKVVRTAPVADLDEAAQQIKAPSHAVYQKLDALTAERQGGSFNDLQMAARSAWNKGDIETWANARKSQDAIFNEFKSQFRPDDLENARANWRQGTALEKIHDSLNTKAILQPTPVALRAKGVPDPGVINGRNFAKQILKLTNDGALKDAGLTPDHIQALQDLGTVLENSANTRKLSKLLTGGGIVAETLGIFTHPIAAASAAAAAAPGYAMSRLLGRVMTDPAAAQFVVKALKAGRVVAPGAAAQGARAVFSGARDAAAGNQ